MAQISATWQEEKITFIDNTTWMVLEPTESPITLNTAFVYGVETVDGAIASPHIETVALFTVLPEFQNGRIVNKNDCLWI